MSRDYAVVVNDCAAVAVVGGPISIRLRDTEHGVKNFNFNPSDLCSGLQRQLTVREVDWLRVLAAIFAADVTCARGDGDLDWYRSIQLHVDVTDAGFWTSLKPHFEEVFTRFTEDHFELNFVESTADPPIPRQSETALPEVDAIALVSGGVDSLVGAAHLIDQGVRPLGVTHAASGVAGQAQAAVEGILRLRLDDFTRVSFSAQRAAGSDLPGLEGSQRSRTMMFLGCAALVAHVQGVDDVYINENGVMAVHMPLTAARIGSLSTHTASPTILQRFEALAAEALGHRQLSIRNELLAMTKPEVVQRGVELDLSEALKDTVSCWAISRHGRHCGTCYPCLMRRISFDGNGVQDADHLEDAFDVIDRDTAVDNLVHLVAQLERVLEKSDLEIQLDAPEVVQGGTELPVVEAIALHRRWANTAIDVMTAHGVLERFE